MHRTLVVVVVVVVVVVCDKVNVIIGKFQITSLLISSYKAFLESDKDLS